MQADISPANLLRRHEIRRIQTLFGAVKLGLFTNLPDQRPMPNSKFARRSVSDGIRLQIAPKKPRITPGLLHLTLGRSGQGQAHLADTVAGDAHHRLLQLFEGAHLDLADALT